MKFSWKRSVEKCGEISFFLPCLFLNVKSHPGTLYHNFRKQPVNKVWFSWYARCVFTSCTVEGLIIPIICIFRRSATLQRYYISLLRESKPDLTADVLFQSFVYLFCSHARLGSLEGNALLSRGHGTGKLRQQTCKCQLVKLVKIRAKKERKKERKEGRKVESLSLLRVYSNSHTHTFVHLRFFLSLMSYETQRG